MSQQRLKYLILAIAIIATLPAYSVVTDHVPNQLIVMLDSDVDGKAFCSEMTNDLEHEVSLVKTLSPSLNIILIEFDPRLSAQIVWRKFARNKSVLIQQYNHTNLDSRGSPNDSLYFRQWAFNNDGINGGNGTSDISAENAWSVATGGLSPAGDTIVVAVIDQGFQVTHPDLATNFFINHQEIPGNGIDDDQNGYVDDIQGWDVYSGDPYHPIDNHGTHVAGTVGATGNNEVGVTGVNWNVKILPISGSSTLESIAVEAYEYVLKMKRLYNQTDGERGAYIVAANSSFGVNNGDPSEYPIWCAMFDSLGQEGVLSVGATANDDVDVDVVGDIPTSCESDYLISVTNMRSNDQLNNNAGYGSTHIDLGAPGTNIYSTRAGDSYGLNTGTSMAAPHVAGTIALMYNAICKEDFERFSSDPADLALFIKDKLLSNGVDQVPALEGITVTGGRLNLYKSVLSVSTLCPQIVFTGKLSQCDSCNGSVKASLIGTSGVSSYLWSTGDTSDSIFGLCAGIYYVTAINNDNDTVTAGYALSDSGGPELSVVKSNVTCFGVADGVAEITGGIGYTWDDGSTGGSRNSLATGSYFVLATDSAGACTTSVEVDIFSPDPIMAVYSHDLPSSDTAHDGNLFVVPSGGTAPYSFLWQTGDTTDSLLNQPNGRYGITITDANNCILTDTGQLGFPMGLNELNRENTDLIFFPNPASNQFRISGAYGGRLRFFSINGQLVLNRPVDIGDEVRTDGLSNGLYFVKLNATNGREYNGRLLVNNEQ